MPFVTVRIVEDALGENPTEKKAEITRRLVGVISEYTGLREDLIWVVFEDIPAKEWYVGTKSAAQFRAELALSKQSA